MVPTPYKWIDGEQLQPRFVHNSEGRIHRPRLCLSQRMKLVICVKQKMSLIWGMDVDMMEVQACSHCPAEDKNKLIISFIWYFYIIFESKYPFIVNKHIFVSNHHTTKFKSWGSWGLSFRLTRLAIFAMLIGLGILAGGAFTSVAARISSTMRGADLVKICCTAFTLTWKELHISHWIYQILMVFNLVVVFMENLV